MKKNKRMRLSKKEIEVMISLIDGYQFDGAQWELEGVSLDKLKNKLIKINKN